MDKWGWEFILYITISLQISLFLPKIATIVLQRRSDVAKLEQKGSWTAPFLGTTVAWITYVQIERETEKWVALLFIFFLMLISFTDLWSGLIPNLFTYPAMIIFLCLRFFFAIKPFLHYLFASLLAGGLIYLIGVLTKGIGGGDIKLLVASGLVLGFPNVLVAFWIGTMLATSYICFKFLRQKINRKEPVIFGPYLAAGNMIAYWWGEKMVDWYFSFYLFY